MPKIVVLGAGIGGISAAYQLRETLDAAVEIMPVSDSEYFQFVPSNPWVALKWRRPKDITVHLPDLLTGFKIGFDATGAKRVRPETSRIELNDGREVSYDYLVIATGPALAFDEIEGLGPQANTISICHVDHAAAAAFEKYFLRKVRRGSAEPAFERFIMSTVGINRLRKNAPPRVAAE